MIYIYIYIYYNKHTHAGGVSHNLAAIGARGACPNLKIVMAYKVMACAVMAYISHV